MQGVERREKCYVEVIAHFGEDGRIMPLQIIWKDGVRYEVSRVLDCRRAASLKVGGIGLRYLVEINGSRTYLFYEGPRWFVEEKVRRS